MTRARADYEFRAEDKTQRAFRRFRRNIAQSTKAMVSFRGTMVGLLGAGGLVALVRGVANAADNIGKMAAVVNLTNTELQAYRLLAEKAKISTGQFDQNMIAFVKRVGEAREGVGPLTSFLKKYDDTLLGAITRTQNQGQALRLVADAIQRAGTATDKAAIANAAFSRSGVTMVRLLNEGNAGLEAAIERAEQYGQILDDRAIKKAAEFNDRLTEVSATLKVQFQQALLDNADSMMDFVRAVSMAIPKVMEFFGVMSRDKQLAAINDQIHRMQTELENLEKSALPDFLTGRPIENYKRSLAELIERRNRLLRAPPELVNPGSPTALAGMPALTSATQEATQAMQGLAEWEADTFRQLSVGIQNRNQQTYEDLIAKTKEAKTATMDFGFTFASAFEDAVLAGGKLRDVVQGLIDDIARMILRSAITEPLGQAIGGAFGSMFTFGGGKQHGGPVAAGTAYMVGESGPELFVPGSSGTVVPNAGGGVVVNYAPVIQAIDTRSGLQFLGQHAGVIVGLVNNAARRRGRRGVG